MDQKLGFVSDYMEGAHPLILQKLIDTNTVKTPGYGTDCITEGARDKVRKACDCENAEVYFISGGTQTNETVITSVLRPYQGVIAAETGHISGHEAGAIEHSGHKVMTVPHKLGKLSAEDVLRVVKGYKEDDNHDHLLMPGMVYISQPTEYGTLYSKEELTELHKVCTENGLVLYMDGARLAYALASSKNDLTLSDYARLCDIFYIGGTKCGALLGEAVVIPKKDLIPHFFTIIKQHGALLAKGRVLGIQFDVLFTDDLYMSIGASAVEYAGKIQEALVKKGIELRFVSPTNQVFAILDNKAKAYFDEKVDLGFWEKLDDDHTVMRFCTSWATTKEDVDKLLEIIAAM